MSRTMQVEVRLFAALREHAGADTVRLELATGATVADALRALALVHGLAEPLSRMHAVIAVNRDYAAPATPLHPDDELALIPPLSGGALQRDAAHVCIRAEPLSAQRVRTLVGDSRAGAVVVFEGVTRDVDCLEYEAYAEMADERIARIVREVRDKHHATAIAAEHRVGTVPLGEPSVIVAASAPHRGEAFAAAREAIDRIKAEVPIWKREVDGESKRWAAGTPAAPSTPAAPGTPELTHVAADGSARMVDVGHKPPSARIARARARVRMSPQTARAVEAGNGPKGEVLGVARLAGIQAAKQTAQLVPLAHPLPLDFVDVTAAVDAASGLVELVSEARTQARTGVEMEAMVACTVAALTVYDMVKGAERGIALEQAVLLEKRGGRSDYRRAED